MDRVSRVIRSGTRVQGTHLLRARAKALSGWRHTLAYRADIRSFFGPLPRGPYRVTFALNREGPFYCTGYGLVRYNAIGADYQDICFLPGGWANKRVSRRVTRLQERRGGSSERA
jgi:hypothetical protein